MSLTSRAGQLTAAGRRLIARHPWLRWLPVLTAASGLVLAVAANQARLDDRLRAWGDTRATWVAGTDHAPGDPIRVTSRSLPVAVLPGAALRERPAQGARARQHIAAGEILTGADIGTGGALDALPDGWRAVPIREQPRSGAAIGDRVDVATEGFVLVEGGVVVDRFDDITLVGVPTDVAPLVALADATGVTLLRTGLLGP